VKSRVFEYTHDGTLLRGELAWDERQTSARPGILVVHEGGGINEHPKARAHALAELGYVALACDMYGNAEFTRDSQRRSELMGSLLNDPSRLRARARAGLDALAADPLVDSKRLAAIGFCFGGLVVLELARSGAPLAGVVSFHGILRTSQAAERGALKAKILACHGREDPFVPLEQVTAFMDEMRNAGADWQVLVHGNAGHGFTRTDAHTLGIAGVAYNAEAETRSWRAMRGFLDEVFG
jgi:dienelactone hydrolase